MAYSERDTARGSDRATSCPTTMSAEPNAASAAVAAGGSPQVGDVALVPVERAVEGQRAAVETDDPEHRARAAPAPSRSPAARGRDPTASR